MGTLTDSSPLTPCGLPLKARALTSWTSKARVSVLETQNGFELHSRICKGTQRFGQHQRWKNLLLDESHLEGNGRTLWTSSKLGSKLWTRPSTQRTSFSICGRALLRSLNMLRCLKSICHALDTPRLIFAITSMIILPLESRMS